MSFKSASLPCPQVTPRISCPVSLLSTYHSPEAFLQEARHHVISSERKHRLLEAKDRDQVLYNPQASPYQETLRCTISKCLSQGSKGMSKESGCLQDVLMMRTPTGILVKGLVKLVTMPCTVKEVAMRVCPLHTWLGRALWKTMFMYVVMGF